MPCRQYVSYFFNDLKFCNLLLIIALPKLNIKYGLVERVIGKCYQNWRKAKLFKSRILSTFSLLDVLLDAYLNLI